MVWHAILNYRLYDLHIHSEPGGNQYYAGTSCIELPNAQIYHSGNLFSAGFTGVYMVCDVNHLQAATNVYEHVGRVEWKGICRGFLMANRAHVLQRGDVKVTAGAQAGVLDLRDGSPFQLDATSTIALYDVTVLGKLPGVSASGSQGAGAAVELWGETTLPANVAWDPQLTIHDNRAASTAASGLPVGGIYTPEVLKNQVVAGSFQNGEYQGAQPQGSVGGMKFCTATYKFEYAFSITDTDGTQFAWSRTPKG